jgi:hypothetical protein
MVPEVRYMLPKREPVEDGKKPIIVIIPKRRIENKLINLFLSGFQKISAIKTIRAAAISSNSCRIIKKVTKLILKNYPKH